MTSEETKAELELLQYRLDEMATQLALLSAKIDGEQVEASYTDLLEEFRQFQMQRNKAAER